MISGKLISRSTVPQMRLTSENSTESHSRAASPPWMWIPGTSTAMAAMVAAPTTSRRAIRSSMASLQRLTGDFASSSADEHIAQHSCRRDDARRSVPSGQLIVSTAAPTGHDLSARRWWARASFLLLAAAVALLLAFAGGHSIAVVVVGAAAVA